MSLIVVVWDNKAYGVRDMKQAHACIVEKLEPWMQEGDYISWAYTRGDLGGPDSAQVVSEDHNPTDAQAYIIKDIPKGGE